MYIAKKSILKAYKNLSGLTYDPKAQGATQRVSALRYFIALDAYYAKSRKDCDTNNALDKSAFTENVGAVVSVTKDKYTSNFYYPLAESGNDYNCGSNFYSVNVVKESKANPSVIHDFPRRGKNPLFEVQNGVLKRNIPYYKNIGYYLNNEPKMFASLVVWLARNFYLGGNDYNSIKQAMYNHYTKDLVDMIMPVEYEKNYVDLLSFSDDKASIEEIDVKNIIGLSDIHLHTSSINEINPSYRSYITAIKSKPFLLLAGISGTGKSRIVRELARACWDVDSEEYKSQKPKNFEMVQVKPNWHDSTELIGYVSRVTGNPVFITGDFLKFVARAWADLETPYFLCLDEMNLAPVEQYFAEFLSVLESRKSHEDGTVTTDPILKKSKEDWFRVLTVELAEDNEALRNQFLSEGITLPQNLIVIGTVNMDETTFSFSRKVLDRAMTIEMNEVDLYGGLEERYEQIGKLGNDELLGTAVEGVDVYEDNKDVCKTALDYLEEVNKLLDGTPFKVAYRTRNEFLLYVVNNLPYNQTEQDEELPQGMVIARALDEITSMKVLSRIEGDDMKVSESLLDNLSRAISAKLAEISGVEMYEHSVSVKKLDEMKRRLASGYTSFWS